jgi:hypothetical protein
VHELGLAFFIVAVLILKTVFLIISAWKCVGPMALSTYTVKFYLACAL